MILIFLDRTTTSATENTFGFPFFVILEENVLFFSLFLAPSLLYYTRKKNKKTKIKLLLDNCLFTVSGVNCAWKTKDYLVVCS